MSEWKEYSVRPGAAAASYKEDRDKILKFLGTFAQQGLEPERIEFILDTFRREDKRTLKQKIRDEPTGKALKILADAIDELRA
jgi:hypothetical protein